MSRERVLLVIEDDPGIQKQLKWSFDDFTVKFADSYDMAIRALNAFEPQVVTLDLGLPPDPANARIGLALLSEILTLAPLTKVIVVTGNDDRENALKAISQGAYDYYQKPIDPSVLRVIVERAHYLYRLEEDNRRLSVARDRIQGVIGDSPKMVMVCRIIEKVANTEVTALLLGESGTGKEVFARAIHKNSERADKPFVAINCASIPEHLLESELFGYEKGAFTGAVKKTPGKVEVAQGGTLFLDEIGDMPLPLQAKLLRFLQERVIEPIGGRVEIPVDVRVVCATNKDIAAMTTEKSFREDLYYRVSEVTIQIPPLRERDADVLLLARYFLHQYSQEMGASVKGFTEDALHAMSEYSWPGNIRELQNKMKSAVIMSESGMIDSLDLGLMVDSSQSQTFNLRVAREVVDVQLITRVVAYTDNNMSRASELLGITRPTLYSLLDKYGLIFGK